MEPNSVGPVLSLSDELLIHADEYDIENTVTKDGVAVTQCWLECEDDAVSAHLGFGSQTEGEQTFKIKIERHLGDMRRYATSDWQADCYVDGRKLAGSFWRNPLEPKLLRHMYLSSGDGRNRKAELAFGKAVSFGWRSERGFTP